MYCITVVICHLEKKNLKKKIVVVNVTLASSFINTTESKPPVSEQPLANSLSISCVGYLHAV